jgi:hypothetical protein
MNATGDTLLESIHRAAARYPRAARTCEELLQLSPTLLRGQMIYLLDHYGEAFWKQAEWLVGLALDLGGSPAQALIEYTVAYLKEQVRFVQTDSYSHTDFDEVFKEVYGNPEVMEKFYLEGLMLTHAFWPIHFDMHAFFRDEFLPRVPDAGTGAEYGFGHGLYLLEVLTHKPGTRARGFDISPSSHKYASRLLRHCKIADNRYSLGLADVRQPLDCPDGAYAWTIFAEIIEHIPDPLFSLRELRRCMAPKAPLFATTVVNSNAIDHLVLYRDVKEVQDLLRDAGFDVVAEKILRVSDYGTTKSKDPSIDVAYVCIPKQ